jgi:DHA3 family multidrug efflux protein-like MFS transporter
LAFIAGGLPVSRFGLGRNPLRAVLAGNAAIWAVSSVFALRSSIVLVTVGMVVWLALIQVLEAGEQTILQRAIPFEKQGGYSGSPNWSRTVPRRSRRFSSRRSPKSCSCRS